MAPKIPNSNHTAVVNHFNQAYGRNESRLASWQQLCRDIGVTEGTSITQCKKVCFLPNAPYMYLILRILQNLKGRFVNIIDFVAAQRNGTAVRVYPSAQALRNYMANAGRSKIFPLYLAKTNPILKWMLIELY